MRNENLVKQSAVKNLYPQAQTIYSNPLKALDADGKEVSISDSDLATEVARLDKEFADLAYSRARSEQFPELREQLDLLFHDMTAGKGTKSGEWYKAVAKVKADNPKG